MLSRIMRSLAALALLATLARADGFMQIDRPTRNAIPMAVKYHKVDVVIDNQVATTKVDQVFVNPNGFNVEATYMFPIPAGASVSKLSMWIDGKEMEAELLDADKARATYEEIVRSQQDPALLEYVGTKMFKLRVFPILPGEEKRVKLEYSETIKADSGLCVYRYPLNTEKFSSKALNECRVAVQVKSNVPLKSLMSPTHSVDVARKNDLEGTVVYEAANVLPDKDFLLYFTQQDGDFGMNMVAQREAGEDGYFMLMLSPKAEATDAELVKRDVCFVIDNSMSMAEEDRMPQAKKALKAGLETLNPGDRFNIVRFSTEAVKWKDALVEVSAENLADAGKFIDAIKARGGTNISEAMQMALSMNQGDASRPYMVIFMTDGEPTLGETDPEKIVKITRDANGKMARIFTLGVGFELNVGLLDRIAEENRGLREYITPTESLETKMAGYYEKIGAPVLSDIKIEFGGASAEIYDIYPKQLSDVFKGQQIAVFGRFKGDGSRSIKLKGSVNGKTREFVYEAGFPKENASHDSIPRLWAISKIGHLMDAIRLKGENEELKKEIVALAKEFGVMTKYTSWLVLEDNARVQQQAGAAGGRLRGADEALRRIEAEDKASDAPAADAAGMELGAKGESAVEASQEAEKAKKGQAMEPGKPSGGFARKDARTGQTKSAVQVIGGKTFYGTDEGWYDQKWDGKAETLKVEYLSDEYFKLLAAKPEVAKWLALGDHVVVVVSGKAYEVMPKKVEEPRKDEAPK
ncbi:MAG: VIT domain-containing protein [Planctomycetota bacterium]